MRERGAWAVHADVYSQYYQYQAKDQMQSSGIHPLKLVVETLFIVHNFGTNSGGCYVYICKCIDHKLPAASTFIAEQHLIILSSLGHRLMIIK